MAYGFMPPGEPQFGELAVEYDAYRVGYSQAVWEYLALHCGLLPGARVVDLGCGNGLSSLPLLERGASVVGVDPESAMLTLAASRLGNRVELFEGYAEDLPLPDAAFDLVLAAQSAQWFREPQASEEIRRVLRPGGAIVYLWKFPAPDTPYTYVVDELLVRITGRKVRTLYGVGSVPELMAPAFADYARQVFEQPVPYTIESYVGWVSSRDRIRQLAGDRRDELLTRLAARLEELEPSAAFVERNLVYVVSARRA